jgi:hypothetical protein
MRRRPGTLIGGLALAGLGLLAACSGSTSHAVGPAVTSPPAVAVTTPASPSSGVSPAPSTAAASSRNPSGAGPPPAGPAACTTAQLAVSSITGQGAAGTEYYGVQFRNRGSGTCTLRGYPGVSLLDAQRRILGQPAARVTLPTPLIVLRPGQVGTATLTVGPAACQDLPPRSAYLRVFPPGQTADVVVSAQLLACRPQIRPVRAGTELSAS